MEHFILTRFNIDLWRKDKCGVRIDREEWLEKRLDLFERYCLPSIMGQTCKEFVWVLLMDENTPEKYKERIRGYRERCPQIRFVTVKNGYGWRFVEVFQGIVREHLYKCLELRGMNSGNNYVMPDADGLCLTTYFDNDDILDARYVEEVQKVANERSEERDYFITYDYGYQYYTELGLTTRIKYRNNHFMTLVERMKEAPHPQPLSPFRARGGHPDLIKTCYGYGSHFMLEAEGNVKVVHMTDKNKPMWTEVIHEGNVDNDVKMTWDTKIMSKGLTPKGLILFGVRTVKQIWRRGKEKIVPRKWE